MTNEEKCWKIIKDMKVSGPWQEHLVHTAMMRLLEAEKASGNSDTILEDLNKIGENLTAIIDSGIDEKLNKDIEDIFIRILECITNKYASTLQDWLMQSFELKHYKKYIIMNWKDITKEQPNDGQRVLTWNEYYKECRIQVYNETCECWDTEDGDDFEYKLTDATIRYWTEMPKNPKFENID